MPCTSLREYTGAKLSVIQRYLNFFFPYQIYFLCLSFLFCIQISPVLLTKSAACLPGQSLLLSPGLGGICTDSLSFLPPAAQLRAGMVSVPESIPQLCCTKEEGWNSCARSASKQMTIVFFAKSVMWPLSPSSRGRRSALSLPKVFKTWSTRHPWPAAPQQQLKCPHCRHHSGLPGSKPRSVCHPGPVFPRLGCLSFLSVPSSEAAFEGEVV